MMILPALFSFLVVAPLTITVLYRTNLFGMQDLPRYYSIGQFLYNNLSLIYLGLFVAQTFVGCYYFVFHYCPFLFSFKPWAHKWADLSSLLLEDSIFGNLFIDVEGRYISGDLILYDKTKVFRHDRILHTFDATHLYALKATNQSTGFFILDLTKPKSLTLYELVKNTEFLIEPFKFTNDATVTYIPNGFRAVEDLVCISDFKEKFQLICEYDSLTNIILPGEFFCHKNIIYQLVEDSDDVSSYLSSKYFGIIDPDGHRPGSKVRSYLAVPYDVCRDSFTAWNKFLKSGVSPLNSASIVFKPTGSDLYKGSSYLYRIR